MRPRVRTASPFVRDTVAMVLAGGRGTRLRELTAWRAKPAVPFGGKFRIIDFALSNCVNSGVRRVGICTQYRSQSLVRHVQRGWSFLDGRFGEFIELMPAQERASAEWYAGTANAVFQNLELLESMAPRHLLVLAGDHVYKMDYGAMLQEHAARGAALSVACVEVPIADAPSFGIVQADAAGRIVDFHEKPERPVAVPGKPDRALASMGIYAFDFAFLTDELRRDAADAQSGHDFGRDVIPSVLEEGAPVYVHAFEESCIGVPGAPAYWRDVGTLDAFWEANLELTRIVPPLDLYDRAWPIWTYQEQMPPAKFVFDGDERRGHALDSLVSGGCIVSGSTVRRSLLFTNVHVHSYCEIEDAVVLPNVDIGRGSIVRRAIVDKDCRLPPGFRVGVDPAADRARFTMSERGIALVTPETLGEPIHRARTPWPRREPEVHGVG